MYTHTRAHTHTHAHTHTRAHTHTDTHTHIHTRAHIHTQSNVDKYQVCAGPWLVCFVGLYTSMYVSLLLRLLTTNGVIWTPHNWINKFYGFYMGHRKELNKSKLTLYKLLLSFNTVVHR